MPTGRPSKYTQDLADKICEELAIGRSLRSVCEDNGMPSIKTIFNWFRTYPEFLQQYTRAKEESADAMSEDTLFIADEAKADRDAVAKAKLQVETRKWLMSKMKPKKYGDKLDLTSDGKVLPTPILGGIAKNEVPSDNSTKKNS